MRGMQYIEKIRSYNELKSQKKVTCNLALYFLQFETQAQPYSLLQGQTTMPVAEDSSLDFLQLKVHNTLTRE